MREKREITKDMKDEEAAYLWYLGAYLRSELVGVHGLIVRVTLLYPD